LLRHRSRGAAHGADMTAGMLRCGTAPRRPLPYFPGQRRFRISVCTNFRGNVSLKVAYVIITETGADVSRFETPGRLSSWTGVCPGSNESAGRIKSAHILPGKRYLKAAWAPQPCPLPGAIKTYMAAKYRRIAARRGPMKPSSPRNTTSSPPPGTSSPTANATPTRRRPLYPAGPRQSQKQRHQKTQLPRLRRHHHPGHRSLRQLRLSY
jgi:hypothetical protein